MKRFITLLALFSFAACQQLSPSVSLDDCAESSLTIKLDNLKTKAYSSDNEIIIESLVIFIYDGNSELELIHPCTAEELSSKSATVKLTTGNKTIAVLTNVRSELLNSLYSTNSLSALKAVAMSLDDNVKDGVCCPIMYGEQSASLTAAGTSVCVSISRYVSRVSLIDIQNKLPAPYGQISLKHAFLCNVVANQNIGSSATPTIWYNMDATIDHSSADNVIASATDSDCATLLFQSLSQSIAQDAHAHFVTDNKVTKTFYAFPNSITTTNQGFSNPFTPSATTLLIVCTVRGEDYYYPIPLKHGLEANTDTEVSLVISGLGNTEDTPFDKIDKADLAISITILDWENGASITELI